MPRRLLNMSLDSLLSEINRPCTKFHVGGFRPTNEIDESWLGKVTLYAQDEELPIDKNSNPMIQIGQFYLPSIQNVHTSLSSVKLLTVFVSSELEGDCDLMDGNFAVREYSDLEGLEVKDFPAVEGSLKSFPLKPESLDSDHAIWDGGGLTPEQEDKVIEMEDDGVFDSYYDVTTHCYDHKFGGYPSFCQPGVDLHPYEFVFQVSSDEKLQLNVIDNGSFQFWRHPETGDWKLYYDFY